MRNKLFFFLNLLIVSVTIAVVMLFAMRRENNFGIKAPEVHRNKTLSIWGVKFKDKTSNNYSRGVGVKFFNDHLSKLKSPELTTAFVHTSWQFLRQTETAMYNTRLVDPSFFLLHEFEFLEGKPISEKQFQEQENILVISRRVRDEFFGKENVVGEYFEYESQSYRIVGVVENVPRSCRNAYADFWTSRELSANRGQEFCGRYEVLLKASDNNNIREIKEEVKALLAKINGNFTKGEHLSIRGPEVLFENPNGYKGNLRVWGTIIKQFLMLMFVPVAGLISLNVVYIRERAEEMAIRKAFGATRFKLISQTLAENILQTFIGGLLGLSISMLIVCFAPNLALGTDTDYYASMTYLALNFRIFLIAFFVILFFGTVSGLTPALRNAKIHPANILKGGQK